MKKFILAVGFLAISTEAFSQAVNLCGELKRLRVWAHGSDNHGIWVEYISNPSQCPGGFYMAHTSDNKDHLYSLLLAAKASKEKVCIQTYPTTSGWTIANRCKINYAMHQ